MANAAHSVAVSDEVLQDMRAKTDLLEAANALLREGRRDLAVDKFREAAVAEERLADLLAREGNDVLRAQALLSAGSAWYMAGEAQAAVSALQMCMDLAPQSTTARLAERTFKAAVVASRAAAGSALDRVYYMQPGELSTSESGASVLPMGYVRYRDRVSRVGKDVAAQRYERESISEKDSTGGRTLRNDHGRRALANGEKDRESKAS